MKNRRKDMENQEKNYNTRKRKMTTIKRGKGIKKQMRNKK